MDPARVRYPRDKPRVERSVHYVQHNFFAGEDFRDIADCRGRAQAWCTDVAGTRIHGTTQRRPVEVFDAEERPRLLPAPTEPFALPSPTPARKWPRIGMSGWPGHCIRCPVTWSGSASWPAPMARPSSSTGAAS